VIEQTTTSDVPLATTSTSTLPPLQHVTDGEVVIATSTEPQTLNAFMAGGDLLTVALLGQAYAAGVFDVEASTLMLIPELVTELPSEANGGVVVNEDGTMTVSYTIR